MISVFDLFSIGIGPSSSHTVGPMRAARDFLLRQSDLEHISILTVTVFGSLALTGHGHGTARALLMGLEGKEPESIDPNSIQNCVDIIEKKQKIALLGKHPITFNPAYSIIYNCKDKFQFHPNAIKFTALNYSGKLISEKIYFSIGGGFILREEETEKNRVIQKNQESLPYPFSTADELFNTCHSNNLTISQLMFANECKWRDPKTIERELLNIAAIMNTCIEKGCQTRGKLPGGLGVARRAAEIYAQLIQHGPPSASHPQAMSWLNVFALAVNEENAAGGRVVTAPTNGAAGIIPAVLNYYKYFCNEANQQGIIDFLMTAGAIGILYKLNASISGAEMGCQGEVGVACSMAAGGLTAALGGSLIQIENAAEIAMEHNLGLTCDPVMGLVQIPCIERNAIATVKAVNASQLALLEQTPNQVSLDMVIATMREIGNDMNQKYKETSKGGLASAFDTLAKC